ncbi:MAG: group III truncated hemoglobin [Microthrixaceae bacterium]
MREHPGTPAPTTAPRRDLTDRTQVHDLVVAFYRELVFDDLLGPLFDEVAEVDWSLHIPKLVDFWCQVLVGQPGYDGYVLGAHQAVNRLERFRPEHFDRWYTLWAASVDARWAGPGAETAKAHAVHTAHTLARRLIDVDWTPPE